MTIDLYRPGQLRSIAVHRTARIDGGVTTAGGRPASVALRCAYRGF